ncbi:class I SAM-dependent methyltransferase [Jongsikchunia kroppenstedtii]|uniref:class I SAM-dependent methyltransferase n=1 Tax=Jongsikchunia kroppenstedtii TaxID=1121721 RepID=UPI00037AB357|nr:class I SAM-dependent methyltransferase [Jongsikchunia kroppenstedtii]
MALYDQVGSTYSATRRPDPRIAAQIHGALDGMGSVVNIGAGAGSYEPPQTMLAIEPSAVMIGQRPPESAPAVRATAEAIPLPDDSVDAALASLTVHHWHDLRAGLAEAVRVTRRRIVIFTWDHTITRNFWLLDDYLPAARETDARLTVPVDTLTGCLPGRIRVEPVPVPADCVDGFAAAYWQRPEAYLDATVRAGMSLMALTPPADLVDGLERLRADIASGSWRMRYRSLLNRRSLDAGYRLIIVDLP